MGEDEDFAPVKVDAGRRSAKDPLFKSAGLRGELVPIRTLGIEGVRNWIGATVEAVVHKSAIVSTRGAFTNVRPTAEPVPVGILSISQSLSIEPYFDIFVGRSLLVALCILAVAKLPFAFVNLVTSYPSVLSPSGHVVPHLSSRS